MWKDIEALKKNSANKLKQSFIDGLYNILLILHHETNVDENVKKKVYEVKSGFISFFEDILINKSFDQSKEISDKMNDFIKGVFNEYKNEMINKGGHEKAGLLISSMFNLLTHLEDWMSSLVNRVWFGKNSHIRAYWFRFLYEIDISIRKFTLTSIEKFFDTFFSDSITYEKLDILIDIANIIQKKFEENIYYKLIINLNEYEADCIKQTINQSDLPQLKGVSITVDDMVLNWTTSYYQSWYETLNSNLEEDDWKNIEIGDETVKKIDYCMYLGAKKTDKEEIFVVVKKQLIYGDLKFVISNAFNVVIDILFKFYQLIFQKKIGTFNLSNKLLELILYYVTYLEELILKGKALEFEKIKKINTKVIAMTIGEIQLLNILTKNKWAYIESLNADYREQIVGYFKDSENSLLLFIKNGIKKIRTILKDLVAKSFEKFMNFDWSDGSISVMVPSADLNNLVSPFQQMYRALESNMNNELLQQLFMGFLEDLGDQILNRLAVYIYNSVSGPRMKDQLNWLLDSLKKIYIKMNLTLENFEVKIKELIFDKMQKFTS